MSWVAPAIMVASAAAQGSSSKKSDDNSNTGTYAGDTAANIALDYYNDSQWLRRGVRKNLEGAAYGDSPEYGGYDPTTSPVFRAGRRTIEDQYGNAKENIIGSMPAGGQLTDKLADVETGRADALGNLAAGTYEDMWNKAFTYATGAPAVSTSTLGNIAGSEAMINAQNSANKSRSMSDIGYALGSMDTSGGNK